MYFINNFLILINTLETRTYGTRSQRESSFLIHDRRYVAGQLPASFVAERDPFGACHFIRSLGKCIRRKPRSRLRMWPSVAGDSALGAIGMARGTSEARVRTGSDAQGLQFGLATLRGAWP